MRNSGHYASEEDLNLDAHGILNQAIILPNRNYIKFTLDAIPEFIRSDEAYAGELMSNTRKYKEMPGITSLVFKESQWSKRKGWKVVERVVVNSKD